MRRTRIVHIPWPPKPDPSRSSVLLLFATTLKDYRECLSAKKSRYLIPPTQFHRLFDLFSWIKLRIFFLSRECQWKGKCKIKFNFVRARMSECHLRFLIIYSNHNKAFRDWFLEEIWIFMNSAPQNRFFFLRSKKPNEQIVLLHRIIISGGGFFFPSFCFPSFRVSLIVLRFENEAFFFPSLDESFFIYLHNDKYRFALHFKTPSRLAYFQR